MLSRKICVVVLLAAAGLAGCDRKTQPSGTSSKPSQENDKVVLDLGGGVTMTLAKIPAGEFFEDKKKFMDFDRPFYMGIYEVTQDQYVRIMRRNPSHFPNGNNPVEGISREDAREFCRRLSYLTGKRIMLPTGAQWRYACHAGTTTAFSYGDDPEGTKLGEYAWYKANSDGKPHPVGQKKPNSWGLYDMHGNIEELCIGAYNRYYEGYDEKYGNTCIMCAYYGGWWGYGANSCEADSYQVWHNSGHFDNDPDGRRGFRVVMETRE